MFIFAVLYALAETRLAETKLFVLQPPLFLNCQVYIPSIIHISKRIYLNVYLSIYTLVSCYIIKVAQKRQPTAL